jgi:hypothetical protein
VPVDTTDMEGLVAPSGLPQIAPNEVSCGIPQSTSNGPEHRYVSELLNNDFSMTLKSYKLIAELSPVTRSRFLTLPQTLA